MTVDTDASHTTTRHLTPSVSGTDAENEAQQHMGGVLGRGGLDVDLWQFDASIIVVFVDVVN